MKKRLLVALAIVSMLASAPLVAGDSDESGRGKTDAPKQLEIGATIPASVAKSMLKGTDGKEYSLAGVAGEKGTLVIFSCNTCPWVVKWEPRIASIGNEYRKKGFGVIVVNSNGAEDAAEAEGLEAMTKRAKDRGFEFPYVFDATSALARAFHATKTPEVFLFNAEKKLVYTGTIDDNASDAEAVEEPYLIDALKATLAGTEIAMKRTKALGCAINFAKPEAEGM